MKITLKSYTLTGLTIGRYRVRQGKAGPNGKPKTDMMLLARASPVYECKKVVRTERHEKFNKFDETATRGVIYDEETNSTSLIWENKQLKHDRHTAKLAVVKMLDRMDSYSEQDEKFLNESVNHLLRTIMMFKGIGVDTIRKDLAKNGGKQVSYHPKTIIELKWTDSEGRMKNMNLTCGQITVRKVFEDGGILFEGNCCNRAKGILNIEHILPTDYSELFNI